jgi:hypothetical protein
MKLSAKLCATAFMVAIFFGAHTAANGQMHAETQFAISGGYHMPAGDFAERTGAPVRETIRGRPDEEARLMEIKRGARRPGEASDGIPAPAATQRSSIQSVVSGAGGGGCQTNSATDYAPSDIHGAVGLVNLVTVTNVDIGVYSKSGCTLISRMPLTALFGAAFTIPSTQTLFDPRVIYDPAVDRFLVTADSDDSNSSDQYQYFAVSQDGSGTSWWLYAFILSQGTTVRFCKNRISDFWDYPSAGSSSTRWYITANDFGTFNATGAIISFDKKASLSGQPVYGVCFNGLRSNLAPPIVTDTATTAYFLSPGGSGYGNSIRAYALIPSALGPGSDRLSGSWSMTVPFWSAAPQAPQPNGQSLDTLDGRFQSASVQTGSSLWNVHAINLGNFARWRLYKFSISTNTAVVLATPTTSDCGNCDHLFNPSVAVNSGKAFVTASRTIPSNSSTGSAAILIFSGPNSSTWKGSNAAFNVIATSPAQFVTDGFGNFCNQTDIQACRWGDYSATQIDPSNTATAWGFNQLIGGSTEFDWTTSAAQAQ